MKTYVNGLLFSALVVIQEELTKNNFFWFLLRFRKVNNSKEFLIRTAYCGQLLQKL